MIKAVLFDVDGVLYNSMPKHTKAWQKAFELINFRLPGKEVYLHEGRRDSEFVEAVSKKYKLKYITKSIIEKLAGKKVKTFDGYPRSRLIPGAKIFLAQVKRSGKKVGLVTGSSQPKTMKRLKQDFGIKRSSVVTGREVGKGKPDPEPFFKAAKKLEVKPKECLVIENAPLGLISAKRAGMKAAAVNTGILTDMMLHKAGAQKVYKSYKSLLKDWNKLL